MSNPYVLLQIKETADEKEIRIALKRQIDLYCNGDENRKNSDGEYLKQIFYNAAKQLLNLESRKKIDMELACDRERFGLEKYFEKRKHNDVIGDEESSVSHNNYQQNSNMKNDVSKEKQRDIHNVYVCKYDGDFIGLFKKVQNPRGFNIWLGLDSDYIGVTYFYYNKEENINLGDECTVNGKSVISNCIINDSASIDEWRFRMYREGIIDEYSFGKATSSEMLKVMCYAADHYNISNNKNQNRK